MNLGWPIKSVRNDFLNATLAVIGRPVDFFYVYSSYACPICDLDPVTNTSTDSFCPVCSGSYFIDVLSGVSISGHVTWKYSEQTNWYAGGMQQDGDVQVRVNYSDSVQDIINKTKYMVVDEREMQIKRITLRGAPDYVRIIVAGIEKEEP